MSQQIKALKLRTDYLLYFAIAFLTMWQSHKWGLSKEALLNALLAGLIGLKAKRSKPRDEEPV